MDLAAIRTMIDIKNILVPIDFSSCSTNALEYALPIAEKTGAKLSLLHTYRLLEKDIKPQLTTTFSLKKELDKDYQEQFDQIEKSYFKGNKINHDYLLEIGFPVDTIQMLTVTQQFDLVVMGTRGSNNVSNILGSTTTSVIHKVNCSVLAIPENAKFKGIHKIALTGDSGNVNDPVIYEILGKILKVFNADFYLLKVKQNNQDKVISSPDLKEFNNFKESMEIEFKENLADDINQFINAQEIDLLTLIPKKDRIFSQLFYGNYRKESPLHSEIPVLAINYRNHSD